MASRISLLLPVFVVFVAHGVHVSAQTRSEATQLHDRYLRAVAAGDERAARGALKEAAAIAGGSRHKNGGTREKTMARFVNALVPVADAKNGTAANAIHVAASQGSADAQLRPECSLSLSLNAPRSHDRRTMAARSSSTAC